MGWDRGTLWNLRGDAGRKVWRAASTLEGGKGRGDRLSMEDSQGQGEAGQDLVKPELGGDYDPGTTHVFPSTCYVSPILG